MGHASFYPHNFVGAAECLAGGKNKNSRPVDNNTRLIRISDDAIALRFHATNIIVYHADGSQTVNTDGWTSVTTRGRLDTYSAIRPWGTGKLGEWAIGTTGDLTPPRVKKCAARGSKWDSHVRNCRGSGTYDVYEQCYGPVREPGNQCAGNSTCPGASTGYARNYDGPDLYSTWGSHPCEHGQTEAHTLSRCEHDREPDKHEYRFNEPTFKYHFVEACSHGQWESHKTQTLITKTCERCNGTGTVDHGSKPEQIVWDAGVASSAVRVAADGSLTFVNVNETLHHAGQMGGATPTPAIKPYLPPPPDPNHKGEEVAEQLTEILPGLEAEVRDPVTGDVGRVRYIIVKLNDTDGWTREQVADWLDTLDVDLSFPAV